MGMMKGINLAGDVLKEDLDVVREAGFTLVRLPVRWDVADRRAVDATVSAALERGFSVVLDVHHFTGTGPELVALWRELGVRFEGVTFELLNEPVDPLWWNEWLPRVLDVVPRRPVIVGPGRWNTVGGLESLALPSGEDLIVTVHYYSPFRFTHQGAFWLDGADDWLGTRWDGDRARIRSELSAAAAWASPRPLFLGEFGTLETCAMPDRVAWTRCVREEAERLGLDWCYWDFATDFGVFDRRSGTWHEPLKHALFGYGRVSNRERRPTMGDGAVDEAKGRTKEAAGALSGDDGLKREGKIDRATGTVKDKVGDAADKLKDAANRDRD
jgi:endoglucanase